MDGLLNGKSVIVTGAGRGLGRAYAVDAASAGASVVVNDLDPATTRSTVDAITASGGVALACAGAVDEPGFGERLVDAAVDAFGQLDGLVANAGVLNAASLFDETSERARRTIETNLMGVIEVGLPAARAMRASRGGSIVLITSASRFGLLNSTTYGATKAAIASLAWGWALEGAAHGIRVNAVSPLALTPMLAGNVVQTTMLPEEVAPAVTYFLSDLSSSITGQILRVYESGLALYPEPRTTSPELTGSGWTAESIARAMEAELAPHLATVGRTGDLSVSSRSDT
jgi:NAD(P)-dependent dehydrogenase (short-subunit alcohol dehydrogenase family)